MGNTAHQPTVLVVDDNRALADAYVRCLEDRYETRVAYDGASALAALDGSVDVVILDRRMPDVSGDEVLEALRERELGCRVILATAVDPDTDILELPLDEYLCKPVDRDSLVDAVERQLSLAEENAPADEFVELHSKLRAIERTARPQEFEEDEQLSGLQHRLERLETKLETDKFEFDEPLDAAL